MKVALIKDSATVVGASMLKMLNSKLGYVYYIAISPQWRGKGIAGKLLNDSIEYFFDRGANEALAGISEDNEESKALFTSRGFRELNFSEMSKKIWKAARDKSVQKDDDCLGRNRLCEKPLKDTRPMIVRHRK